jgi:hypothetical protein
MRTGENRPLYQGFNNHVFLTETDLVKMNKKVIENQYGSQERISDMHQRYFITMHENDMIRLFPNRTHKANIV